MKSESNSNLKIFKLRGCNVDIKFSGTKANRDELNNINSEFNNMNGINAKSRIHECKEEIKEIFIFKNKRKD